MCHIQGRDRRHQWSWRRLCWRLLGPAGCCFCLCPCFTLLFQVLGKNLETMVKCGNWAAAHCIKVWLFSCFLRSLLSNWCLKCLLILSEVVARCQIPATSKHEAEIWLGRTSLADQTIKVPVRFSVKDQKVNICCGSILGSHSELFLSCPEQYLESNEKWQELTNKSD